MNYIIREIPVKSLLEFRWSYHLIRSEAYHGDPNIQRRLAKLEQRGWSTFCYFYYTKWEFAKVKEWAKGKEDVQIGRQVKECGEYFRIGNERLTDWESHQVEVRFHSPVLLRQFDTLLHSFPKLTHYIPVDTGSRVRDIKPLLRGVSSNHHIFVSDELSFVVNGVGFADPEEAMLFKLKLA